MKDIIYRLPDSVANQIAAGEVIQRPAAVVKELVENAVDAGATEVQVIIRDAGKTLIQVIDNGTGMSDTDVRMAFERHATSKIRKADDLFSLVTMGFRGEALPSICAIAEVEVLTRLGDSAMGTRLLIEGSRVVSHEPYVCEKGTSISVRKIFFNVPARRKFLKSDSGEMAQIMREFERLALVNNRIRMTIDTGTKIIRLREASLRLRIEELFRNTLKSDHLIPVNVDTSLVKIEGFVTRPEYARRRNPLQFLIVNSRNMRHPYFHKAITGCFDSLIASDTMPCYFMRFTVDPSSIDVNIHPTKDEIKFEYEHQIWPILVSAVKTALGKFAAVPSIDFDSDAIPLHPLQHGEHARSPQMEYRNGYNPFQKECESRSHDFTNWEKLYEGFLGNGASGAGKGEDIQQEAFSPGNSRNLPEDGKLFGIHGIPSVEVQGSTCIQLFLKYIVTSSRSELLVIDQYRAHVKVIYEELLHSMERQEILAQSVMFPETVSLDVTQQETLEGMKKELTTIGFTLEKEGAQSWKITTVPALKMQVEPKELVLSILDSRDDGSPTYGNASDPSQHVRHALALSMARASAVRRGQRLSSGEMENIVSSLFALPDPALTPYGAKIYTSFNEEKLSSMFTFSPRPPL